MKPDPRIRKDKRCAQCKGPRLSRLPKVITQIKRAELLKNLTADPFCSAVCCRLWHGVDIGEEPQKASMAGVKWEDLKAYA